MGQEAVIAGVAFGARCWAETKVRNQTLQCAAVNNTSCYAPVACMTRREALLCLYYAAVCNCWRTDMSVSSLQAADAATQQQ